MEPALPGGKLPMNFATTKSAEEYDVSNRPKREAVSKVLAIKV